MLEEISFKAPERKGDTVAVDESLVRDRPGDVLENEDLSRYIL